MPHLSERINSWRTQWNRAIAATRGPDHSRSRRRAGRHRFRARPRRRRRCPHRAARAAVDERRPRGAVARLVARRRPPAAVVRRRPRERPPDARRRVGRRRVGRRRVARRRHRGRAPGARRRPPGRAPAHARRRRPPARPPGGRRAPASANRRHRAGIQRSRPTICMGAAPSVQADRALVALPATHPGLTPVVRLLRPPAQLAGGLLLPLAFAHRSPVSDDRDLRLPQAWSDRQKDGAAGRGSGAR